MYDAVEQEAVRRAIAKSGGERTTEGVVVRFVCGACGQTKTRAEHDGGVWAKGPDGSTFHATICRDCSKLHDPAAEENHEY